MNCSLSSLASVATLATQNPSRLAAESRLSNMNGEQPDRPNRKSTPCRALQLKQRCVQSLLSFLPLATRSCVGPVPSSPCCCYVSNRLGRLRRLQAKTMSIERESHCCCVIVGSFSPQRTRCLTPHTPSPGSAEAKACPGPAHMPVPCFMS